MHFFWGILFFTDTAVAELDLPPALQNGRKQSSRPGLLSLSTSNIVDGN
jgi:hypothetical protein